MDPQVTLGDPFFTVPRFNIAPRLGWAYDPRGNGKTVLRGGVGIFFIPPLFYLYSNPAFRSLPYSNRARLKGSDVVALPVSPDNLAGSSLATESFQYDYRPSYSLQANLNFQREIAPRMVFSAAYVGSHGVNLIGAADVNTAIPTILPSGEKYFPAGGQRRNPLYDTVRRVFQGFNSHYHSLNVGLAGTVHSHLELQGSYTFGKSIDDFSGTGRQTWSNGQARCLDPYDRRPDRARSNFDVRHRITLNASWAIPSLSKAGLWVDRILGHGRLNGIAVLSSGVPFTPVVAGDPDQDATEDNTARANLAPGVSLVPSSGASPDLWFNPAAFATPRIGFRGNAGRNILTGPPYRELSLSWIKEVSLRNEMQLQFRAEVFNLLNHPNLDLPANAEDGEVLYLYTPTASLPFQPAASVGRIFSTLGDAREIQFGLKLIF
jgi:hypothetical protein